MSVHEKIRQAYKLLHDARDEASALGDDQLKTKIHAAKEVVDTLTDPHAEWLEGVKREICAAPDGGKPQDLDALSASHRRDLDAVARRVVAKRCAGVLRAWGSSDRVAQKKRIAELDAIAEGGPSDGN